jgi:ribose-phosphate pyrophosphokinase
VRGKDAILIDDMTSTCGTLIAAAEMLVAHGAKSVRAAVTHGMLNQMGLDRLKISPIKELIVSDSVPMGDLKGYPVTVLSVSELFAKAILRIHNNQSINELFHV